MLETSLAGMVHAAFVADHVHDAVDTIAALLVLEGCVCLRLRRIGASSCQAVSKHFMEQRLGELQQRCIHCHLWVACGTW